MNFAIICNPENRRCQFFIDAVNTNGYLKPVVISYIDILQNTIDVKEQLTNIDVLKIESFGENFEVSKLLIALASNLENDFISKKEALNLPFDLGRIQHVKQQYFGYKILLEKIQKTIKQLPKLQVMNSVNSILLAFDKTQCHQYFTKNDIPTIPAIYNMQSFDDLLEKIKEKSWNRVFIKANYGSSASGVIAFRINGNKMQAITSVELMEKNGQIKLYNSLKIRAYYDFLSIKKIVNILAKDGLLVEKWIPKSSNNNGVFDFRIVTINQRAKHTISRQSKTPLTNLHLGNKRGDLEMIIEKIGAKSWLDLQNLAEKTAQILPNMLYSGLDILLSKSNKYYVIEANAFGDLLPNLLISGRNTYEAQIYYYKNRNK